MHLTPTCSPPSLSSPFQLAVGRIWHRFRYAANRALADDMNEIYRKNKKFRVEGSRPYDPPAVFQGDVVVDDAFATIMQWLHSRIEATR